MKYNKRAIAALGAVVLLGASGVAANALASRSEPEVARLDSPLVANVDIALDSYLAADRLPIMPERPIVEVSPGDEIILGRYGGLERVSATLNGARLETRAAKDAFVVTIGDIVGDGAATLLLTEGFDNGDELTLPYTVYVGPRAPAPENLNRTAAPTPAWSVSIPFGDAESELGFIAGDEAEAITPTAFVGLADGRVAVLDTAKQRVVSVGAKGDVVTMAKLPSMAYTSFASNLTGTTVLAVNQVTAEAIDVAAGTTIELPDTVARLPYGIDFAVDDSGMFYAKNPGDAVMYSLGDTTGRSVTGDSRRLADQERVAVTDGVMLVQATTSARPVQLDFPGSAWIDVLDHAKLDDGRVVVLAGSMTGETPTIELYVISGHNTAVIEVATGFDYQLSNYLTVLGGNTVVVANPTGAGLELNAYAV